MIFNPATPIGRATLAAGVMTLLVVVACAVPTTYEAELGKSFNISLPEGTEMPAIDQALRSLDEAGVAEEVSVSVSERIGEPPTVNLMLWGTNVNEAEVRRVLGRQDAAFNKATWEVTPLEGSVESNYASKLGHDLFNIDLSIDEGDVESAREQIMEQLAAQGFTGNVDIQTSSENGQEMVKIMLSDVEMSDPEKAAGSTLIEMKTEAGQTGTKVRKRIVVKKETTDE